MPQIQCWLVLLAASFTLNATAVNGERLILSSAYLAINSTVLVTNGAVLQLNFTGTNQVAALVFNGISQADAVYNLGSTPICLAGTGSLKVVRLAPPQVPTIGPISLVGTNLVLTLPATSGLNYVLQQATNLTSPVVWQNVSTNAGTGSNLVFNVSIDLSWPQNFIRFLAY